MTDAKNQRANHEYFNDNNLKRVYYTTSTGTPITNTPEVSYTYDAYFNRLATHTYGIGTTSYSYIPYNSADTVYGDGGLHEIDGPWSNDTITYEYDDLGRVKKRQIDGTANESSATWDDAGRVTNVTNNLAPLTTPMWMRPRVWITWTCPTASARSSITMITAATSA